MTSTIKWGVALLSKIVNGEPEIVAYPSEEVAVIAARSWHLWDTPLVVRREVPEWTVNTPERDFTLTEAVKILNNSNKR